MHRGVIVPRSLTATGYSSALAPKSDAYLPDVKVEGGAISKTVPSGHQGTVDLPDIAIPEGGGSGASFRVRLQKGWSRIDPL